MKSDSMADWRPEFVRLQYEFTKHIRDPELNPAPTGIEDRRLKIYRELLYNNIERFISNNFPVLRKITPDHEWHAMVRDYFAHHESHTPLFPKLPQEFLRYVETERADDGDPPFLAELAHYEWVESGLRFDTREISYRGIDRNGDLLARIPVVSPLAWSLTYRFPVHRIGPEFLPAEPPETPTYLVVYRDSEDEVGFMELNPVSARLIDLIRDDSGRTGQELLYTIANELEHHEPQRVIDGGTEILRHLKEREVVLGAK